MPRTYRKIEVMVSDEEYAALCEQARRDNEHNAKYSGETVTVTPEGVAGGAIMTWLCQQAEAARRRAETDELVAGDESYRDYQQLRRDWGEYLEKRDRERWA